MGRVPIDHTVSLELPKLVGQNLLGNPAQLSAQFGEAQLAENQVKFINIPEEAQRKAMLGQGMPEWQVDALMDLQRYYTGGKGGEVTDVLPLLLGRPPITLDGFLVEFKHQFSTAA